MLLTMTTTQVPSPLVPMDISSISKDGQASVQLDKVGGQVIKKTGGFDKSYELVAAPLFNKSMQDRCIFGFKSSSAFTADCGSAARALSLKVQYFLKECFPRTNMTSKGVHVLFNWNAHSRNVRRLAKPGCR